MIDVTQRDIGHRYIAKKISDPRFQMGAQPLRASPADSELRSVSGYPCLLRPAGHRSQGGREGGRARREMLRLSYGGEGREPVPEADCRHPPRSSGTEGVGEGGWRGGAREADC